MDTMSMFFSELNVATPDAPESPVNEAEKRTGAKVPCRSPAVMVDPDSIASAGVTDSLPLPGATAVTPLDPWISRRRFLRGNATCRAPCARGLRAGPREPCLLRRVKRGER